MPTARELLEQADALMRRNRSRDFEPDIPELTDEVAVASVPPAPASSSVIAVSRVADDGVPELTEVVGEVEDLSIQLPPDDGGEISRWLEVSLGEASVTGPAPDSVVVVPSPTFRAPLEAANEMSTHGIQADATRISGAGPSGLVSAPVPALAPEVPAGASTGAIEDPAGPASDLTKETPPEFGTHLEAVPEGVPAETAFEQDFPRMEPSAAISSAQSEAAAPPEPDIVPAADTEPRFVGDAARWATLAEDIRMQVLQRIDIYTDTGLSGELASRLQPIVDRASADLVTTINQQVGQLLRAYVAEAIERDIEKWRKGNP